mgnify:CR=1 FL=1
MEEHIEVKATGPYLDGMLECLAELKEQESPSCEVRFSLELTIPKQGEVHIRWVIGLWGLTITREEEDRIVQFVLNWRERHGYRVGTDIVVE